MCRKNPVRIMNIINKRVIVWGKFESNLEPGDAHFHFILTIFIHEILSANFNYLLTILSKNDMREKRK